MQVPVGASWCIGPWHAISPCCPAGKAKILDTVRDVVALHKERHVFPVKVAVTKVSGSGQDSIFMGVIKPVPDDPTSVKVSQQPQLVQSPSQG
jgi:hypothetical protein